MFVSLDTETALIEAGRLDPDLVCVQICAEDLQPELVDQFGAEQVISDLLACPDITLVGANIAFDFAVIIRAFPQLLKAVFAAYRAGRVLDIQLAARLQDNANGELGGAYNHLGVYVKYYYSLAALYDRWGLGTLQKEGTWRLRYGELRGKRLAEYPQEAIDYALGDASATMKVWQCQNSAYPHLLKDLAAQTRAAFALHLMSVRGIHTDEAACAEYLTEVREEIEQHKKLLVEHGLLRANGSKDTKKAKTYMLAACAVAGIEPHITATGKDKKLSVKEAVEQGYVSLDAEACRDVNDPVMKAYASFVSAKTTLERTEQLALGARVPLQTRFEPLVANGRSSSMAPGEPLIGQNLQNVPTASRMRHVFKARRDVSDVHRPAKWTGALPSAFCSVDFTGAELHSFAQAEFWTTGSSLIGNALNQKRDLHCHLAAALLGCPYEEVFANKSVGKYAWARKVCKNANFGLLGAMGAEKFMLMTNKNAKRPEDRITLELAETLRALWFETWQTQKYFDYISSLFNGQGAVSVEHFISGRIRGKVTYTECANGFFSGLTADAFKAALWALTEACYTQEDSVLFGSRPLLAIHDEILAELLAHDPKHLHDAAFEMARVMIDAYNQYTPDFPVRAKPALSRHWFKKAEESYDENGLLRCWEPQRDDLEYKPKDYLKSTLIELV